MATQAGKDRYDINSKGRVGSELCFIIGTMSYETMMHNDPSSRVASNKAKQDYDRRVFNYEKEFDVSVSRIETREKSLRDSMIAYTERMRSIADSRNNASQVQNDPLFVRAKHIPKYPNKGPRKRRPMSFDELLGRDRDQPPRPQGAKPRPLSEKDKPRTPTQRKEKGGHSHTHAHSDPHRPISFPVLPDRLKQSSQNVRVSFVSASDLYELVDFSLRNKGTKQDSIQILRMEEATNEGSKQAHKKDRRSPKTPERVEEISDFYETPQDSYGHLPPLVDRKENHGAERTVDVRLPEVEKSPKEEEIPRQVQMNRIVIPEPTIKARPKRAKRMRLQTPGLGDIPEHGVLQQKWYEKEKAEYRALMSPPPPELASAPIQPRTSLYSIPETENDSMFRTEASGERKHEYRSILPIVDGNPKRTRRILMRDDGDVRIEVTQCPPKNEPMNAKLKGHKRLKKLIYLRDIPDRSQVQRMT